MDPENTVDLLEHHLDPLPLEPTRRGHHLTMLGLMLTVIVLSFGLRVTQGDRVSFRMLPDKALPHSCMSKAAFGYECPGCGLTRSFIKLAEGRVRDAWQLHRVGWLMAIAVLTQIPYRIHRLRNPSLPTPKWTRWFSGVLIVALIGNWIIKLIGI